MSSGALHLAAHSHRLIMPVLAAGFCIVAGLQRGQMTERVCALRLAATFLLALHSQGAMAQPAANAPPAVGVVRAERPNARLGQLRHDRSELYVEGPAEARHKLSGQWVSKRLRRSNRIPSIPGCHLEVMERR